MIANCGVQVIPMLHRNTEAGLRSWTNNACKSMNNVLKVRTQWRLNQLPELIEKLRKVVVSQLHEADRTLMGRGEFHLHPSWVRHRLMMDVWATMSDQQRHRAQAECYRLQSAPSTSTSTDGDLTVNYRHEAGKKVNQWKRRRAERSTTQKADWHGQRHRLTCGTLDDIQHIA